VDGLLNISLVRALRASKGKSTNLLLGIAVNLLCLLLLVYITFPGSRHYTQALTQLSYYNENTGRYALGPDDTLFLCFWIVLLTGLRAGVIDYALIPLAAWAGIERKKLKVRFAEQAWLVCHHGTFWLYGMVSCPTAHYRLG
jgi:very-long-chain ceramide synthase